MSLPVRIRHGQSGLFGVVGTRQRNVDPERRAVAGGALDHDRAAHALDDLVGNRQTQAGAAEFPRRRDVGLLEFQKDARLILQRDADAGIVHGDRYTFWLRRRLDDDRHAAALRELDRIAGEVEQHLAEPRRVADHPRRQPLVDIAADFEAFGLGARTKELDDFLDECRKWKRPRREIEAAGFDLGEIEDLLDQRQQRLA